MNIVFDEQNGKITVVLTNMVQLFCFNKTKNKNKKYTVNIRENDCIRIICTRHNTVFIYGLKLFSLFSIP